MKKLITSFLLFAICSQGFSQSEIQYNIVGEGGLLRGNDKWGMKAELLQGIKFKDWTLGLGAAWDSYGQKSVPVYAEVKRFILPGKVNPFVYGSGGLNLVQKKLIDDDWQTFYNKSGRFYEGGIGLKLKQSKLNWYISGGYSHKTYIKRFDTKNVPPSTDNNWREELYKFNRYIIKFGIGN